MKKHAWTMLANWHANLCLKTVQTCPLGRTDDDADFIIKPQPSGGSSLSPLRVVKFLMLLVVMWFISAF